MGLQAVESSPRPRSGRGAGGEGARWRTLLATAFLVTTAQATPLDQLHQFLSQTTSAKGDFTQQGTSGKAPSSANPAPTPPSKGSFEFLRPGRFRWTYTSPYEQLIISDGATLFLYDKDLAQVTKRKLNGALPASPASILFGSNDFEHDFQVDNDGSRDGIDWIRATPRTKDSMFERIRIGFADGLPIAMELRDSFGQSTQLRFEHVQRNPTLAADRFAFTPPKGVDVLEDQ